MTELPGTSVNPAPKPPGTYARFFLVQALQLPALGLVIFGLPPWSFWCAAVWGSVVCSAGTDSVGPWRNRILRVQAITWIVIALVFGW